MCVCIIWTIFIVCTLFCSENEARKAESCVQSCYWNLLFCHTLMCVLCTSCVFFTPYQQFSITYETMWAGSSIIVYTICSQLDQFENIEDSFELKIHMWFFFSKVINASYEPRMRHTYLNWFSVNTEWYNCRTTIVFQTQHHIDIINITSCTCEQKSHSYQISAMEAVFQLHHILRSIIAQWRRLRQRPRYFHGNRNARKILHLCAQWTYILYCVSEFAAVCVHTLRNVRRS